MAQARNEIRYTDQQKEALERRVTRVSDESGKWEAQKVQLEQRKKGLEAAVQKLGQEISSLRSGYIQGSEKYRNLPAKTFGRKPGYSS